MDFVAFFSLLSTLVSEHDHWVCSETSLESNTEKHCIPEYLNYQPLVGHQQMRSQDWHQLTNQKQRNQIFTLLIPIVEYQCIHEYYLTK